MDVKLVREMGAIALIGIVVFGWVFTRPPLPEQLSAPKAAKQHTTIMRRDAAPDPQIPRVRQSAANDISITIEPVALQTPTQALAPTSSMLQVAATSLNLRDAPSAGARSVEVYERGSTFERIGEDGQWLKVRSTRDGITGWMFADYLQTAE